MTRKYTKIQTFIKPVMDAIRKGAKTWSDLKKLKPEIPDKTLSRILDYLEYWGLAKQKAGLWYWYESLRFFKSDIELKLALEHSQQLIPAFDNIKKLSFNLKDPLFGATKQHLRDYPEAYQKLETLMGAVNEENKRLIQNSEYTQKVIDKVKINKPFEVFQFMLNSESYPEHVEFWDEMLEELKPLREPYFEIYRNLSEELTRLEIKIKNGTPLEGHCDLCPQGRVT